MVRMARARCNKDVGKELDIILGLRNMFGVRGLGLDLRTGWFFPGDAYDREDGLRPDLGVTVFAQFLY